MGLAAGKRFHPLFHFNATDCGLWTEDKQNKGEEEKSQDEGELHKGLLPTHLIDHGLERLWCIGESESGDEAHQPHRQSSPWAEPLGYHASGDQRKDALPKKTYSQEAQYGNSKGCYAHGKAEG
jgi:hypothetical protein